MPRHVQTSADNDHQTAHVKYRLVEPSAHAPWHASMRNHVGALVGMDALGDLALDLLTGSLAPTTYTTTTPECHVSRFFATKKESSH
jgi:hypothetical protein